MTSTTSRLVCGPYRRALEPAFIRLIAELPRPDPLAPLPIVIPSNAVARRLKTVLAASGNGSSAGFLNIEWLTILDVAKRVWREVPPSAVEMQPEVKRLIGAALTGRVVKEEIGAGSYFAGVKDFAGFARGLSGCLRDLKEAGIRPQDLTSLRNLPPKVAEIGRLYAAHERRLAAHGLIEDEDILRAAAVACRGSDTARSGAAAATSPWLAARPSLVLYGLYDPTPLQRALIEAIARHARVWAFAPVEPGHPACRYAEPTIAWLRGLLGAEASACGESEDSVLVELASKLFAVHARPQTTDFRLQTAEPGSQTEGRRLQQFIRERSQSEVCSLKSEVSPVPADSPVTVVSVGGRTEEIEAIADRILALKARDPSLRWDDIAVLFRVADDYRDTVTRIFTRRGIPFLFPRAPSVAQHPLAQAFLRLASLSQRDFAADDVAELLVSPWLCVQELATSYERRATSREPQAASLAARSSQLEAQPCTWDRLIRQAGIVSGRAGWRDGLARLDRIVEPEDRVQFESLRAALDGLFALHDAKPADAPVRDWIAWLGRLLAVLNCEGGGRKEEGGKFASFLHLPSPFLNEASDVLRALVGAVQSLWAVEGIVPRWTYEEALGWLATAVEQQSTSWSLHGDRVLVADVMAARGLSFDTVFLAGMVEHGFPRQIGQDPFLMDWERRDLSERLETLLPPKRDRGYQEEKFLFYLAVRAAQRRLVLLYQRVDEEGKDRVPSYYLYEVKRLLGERLREETVPLSRLEAVETLPDSQLSRTERDAAALRRALHQNEALPLASALLRDPQHPLLARALQGEERRWWSRALDEHDGVLRFSPADSFGEAKRAGPDQDAASTASRLSIVGQVLSPTRLEDYGRCPYLYLAKHVLRLEPLPEPTAELERRLIGNLYHDALYRFYTALRQEGYLPLLKPHGQTRGAETPIHSSPVPGWDSREGAASRREELLARLRTIVQEVCAEFERQSPTGLPLLWAMEQEAIQANLATLVATDLARTDDFEPAYFEASFGQPVPEGADQTISTDRPLELRLGDDLVLRFRGRIDRIDVDAATRRARVFDYKSGKPKSLRLDQGEQFQLPLYLMAVEDLLLSGHQVAEAVLWFIGDEKGRRAMTRVEWESGKLQVLEALRDYARAIRRGIFFPYPGDHCRFCDFATICRKSPVSRLERKYGDPDAKWYVELKEGA